MSDWTTEPGQPPVPTDAEQAEAAAEARRERMLRPARIDKFTNAWTRLRRAVATFQREVPAVAAELVEQEDWAGMAQTIQAIQDYRASLARTEAYLTRELGRAMGAGTVTLPSGALGEVRKSADRKAWKHTEWQHDVRLKVSEAILPSGADAVVDPESGETFHLSSMLFSAMERVQAAHGAGAPKVTTLKALGLDVADYCEVNPGPWSIQITASQPTT